VDVVVEEVVEGEKGVGETKGRLGFGTTRSMPVELTCGKGGTGMRGAEVVVVVKRGGTPKTARRVSSLVSLTAVAGMIALRFQLGWEEVVLSSTRVCGKEQISERSIERKSGNRPLQGSGSLISNERI